MHCSQLNAGSVFHKESQGAFAFSKAKIISNNKFKFLVTVLLRFTPCMIPRFDSPASVNFSNIESNNDTFKKFETQFMVKRIYHYYKGFNSSAVNNLLLC